MGSPDQSHRRSLAAIFSDLEGHSLVWTRTPREKMVAAIGEYRYLSELIASQYGALHRNFTGDGHLFLFRTADAAVQFGLKLIDAWVHCRNTASALPSSTMMSPRSKRWTDPVTMSPMRP